MESRECVSNNLAGQCMFNFECMQHKGRAIGICIERYYVGSCCHFNSTNELKTPNDHRETAAPNNVQNNSLKLRMVNKSNITGFIQNQVNKLFSDSTTTAVRKVNNQPEKVSSYSNRTTSTSPPAKPDAQISNEENDSANFINFTGFIDPSVKLPIKLNYLEQTKPTNLIEHQTTISNPDRVNYLSTDSIASSSDGSAGSSGEPLVEQQTSPLPFNNSQVDRLIDYQLPSTTTEASTPNVINFIGSSASSLPSESSVEKFLMNQGWTVKLC